MNPYDKAHELAGILRSTDEHKAFVAAKAAMDTDPEARKMAKDFLRRKMELEFEAMSGKGEDAAKVEALRRMYEVLSINAKARLYVDAYMRFQRLMADISKIIGDSFAEGLDIFAQD